MIRAALIAFAIALVGAPAASASPAWLPPADLSQPGRTASNPKVAMSPSGETVALWERQSVVNPSFNVQLSTRSPGGGFTPPVDLSLASTDPDVAMTPGGEAVAAWRHFVNPPGNYTIQVATRPPGGSFSAPTNVVEVPSGALPTNIQVAVNANGDIAVIWQRLDPTTGFEKLSCTTPPELPLPCPNPYFVEAAVRPAGGGFTSAARVSPPRPERPNPPPGETPLEKEEREKAEEELDIEESVMSTSSPSLAIDPAGNAIVAWAYFDGTNRVIQTSVRPPGGAFSVPTAISDPGQNSGEPDVAFDSGGTASAVWYLIDGTDVVIRSSTRPPGGSFGSPVTISPTEDTSSGPQIAFSAAGVATAIWTHSANAENVIQSATRPPGGAFSSPENVSDGSKDNALFPQLDVNAEGDAAVVWSGSTKSAQIARGAVRRAGSTGWAPFGISLSSTDLFHPYVGLDGGGDATAVWTRSDGKNNIVQMAGYDSVAPELRNVSIPSSGTVGVPVVFSGGTFDVWPIGPPNFAFGDGSAAAGASVSHIYTVPGNYLVTATATDAAGTATPVSSPIKIVPVNTFTIGKLKLNKKKGTGTLTVTVPGPGTVALSGKGIKKASKRAKAAGRVEIPVKAAGKSLKKLKRNGKAKLQAKIEFTPDGGTTSVQRRKLTLVKKLP